MSIVPFQSDDRPTGDALSLPAVNDRASRARLVNIDFYCTLPQGNALGDNAFTSQTVPATYADAHCSVREPALFSRFFWLHRAGH